MEPDPPQDTDARIVSNSLDDPESFGKIYDKYASEILRFAARRLGVDAALDVTADTFLIAFQTGSASTIEPAAPARGCMGSLTT